MKTKVSQRRRRFAQGALGAILAISVSGLLLGRLSGRQLLSVQSNSMLPVLRPGDAVAVVPVEIGSLKPGTIISYREPVHPMLTITHRITSIDRRRGLVTTRGDDSSQADRPINQQLLVGRVSRIIPKMGWGLNFMRTPAGLAVGTYFPALIISGIEISGLTAAYKHQKYRLMVIRDK